MGLKGSVKAFSLDQLFEFLHASGHMGTLRVTHKTTAKKTIYLWHGGVYVERSEWSSWSVACRTSAFSFSTSTTARRIETTHSGS